MNEARQRLEQGKYIASFEIQELKDLGTANGITVPDTLETKEEVMKYLLDHNLPLYTECGDKY